MIESTDDLLSVIKGESVTRDPLTRSMSSTSLSFAGFAWSETDACLFPGE